MSNTAPPTVIPMKIGICINRFRVSARNDKRGFTLVELLVVIAIIAILSVVGVTVFSGVQKSARDAKRKADLGAIYKALEIYFYQNGKYPPAGGCSYGANCYVYSTDGISWIPALVPNFMQKVPQDPINNTAGPWNTGSYSYAYGNVAADGQAYDLTAQLENTSDPDRCGVKNYKWYFDNRPWCIAFEGGYSNQIYEKSPLTP